MKFDQELTFKEKPTANSSPLLTTIGSSNFGKRSLNRDSELVFWVLGEGPKFNQMVDNEKERLEPFVKEDDAPAPRRKIIKDAIIDSLNLF